MQITIKQSYQDEPGSNRAVTQTGRAGLGYYNEREDDKHTLALLQVSVHHFTCSVNSRKVLHKHCNHCSGTRTESLMNLNSVQHTPNLRRSLLCDRLFKPTRSLPSSEGISTTKHKYCTWFFLQWKNFIRSHGVGEGTKSCSAGQVRKSSWTCACMSSRSSFLSLILSTLRWGGNFTSRRVPRGSIDWNFVF